MLVHEVSIVLRSRVASREDLSRGPISEYRTPAIRTKEGTTKSDAGYLALLRLKEGTSSRADISFLLLGR